MIILEYMAKTFMDSEINQAMVHPKGPRSRQYFVNDPADMGDYF